MYNYEIDLFPISRMTEISKMILAEMVTLKAMILLIN